MQAMRELLSTKEVADYLRLKERKIYHLVSTGAIPHTRISGKLLFPRGQIDAWLGSNLKGGPSATAKSKNSNIGGTFQTKMSENTHHSGTFNVVHSARSNILSGSHDPLLEWAVRESRCGLALMSYGSLDGIDRLVSGEACAAAIHLPPARGSERNIAIVRERLPQHDTVLIHWSDREQGLVLPAGNPRKVRTLHDLARTKARVIARQTQSGSYLLLLELLGHAELTLDALKVIKQRAQTESDVAAAILESRADAGLAVRAVAQQFRLAFVPLATERLDLAISRRAFFEPPIQALLAFTRTPAFRDYANDLAGYDTRDLGKVVFNS
jgi:putative molybdopterin biosynthesis protein